MTEDEIELAVEIAGLPALVREAVPVTMEVDRPVVLDLDALQISPIPSRRIAADLATRVRLDFREQALVAGGSLSLSELQEADRC